MGNWNSGRRPSRITADGGFVSDKLLSQELEKQLREDPDQPEPKRRTKAARIVAFLVKTALAEKGKQLKTRFDAIKETWNRHEGTPVQSMSLSVKDPEQQRQRVHSLLSDLDQLQQLENMGNDGPVN